MSEPNEQDTEWALRSMAYIGMTSKAKVFAAHRLEIEAATRAKVLAEVEAFADDCPEDQTSQALAEFLYRLRGTP